MAAATSAGRPSAASISAASGTPKLRSPLTTADSSAAEPSSAARNVPIPQPDWGEERGHQPQVQPAVGLLAVALLRYTLRKRLDTYSLASGPLPA